MDSDVESEESFSIKLDDTPGPRQMGEGALDSDSSGGAAAAPLVTPGPRSPHFTPQIRGLTMEEYDEHLPSLSKENINLKEADTLRREVLIEAERALHLMEEKPREEMEQIQKERDAEKSLFELQIRELEAVQELSERDRIVEEKQAQSEALRSSLADYDATIAHLENELAKYTDHKCNVVAVFDMAVHEQELLVEAFEEEGYQKYMEHCSTPLIVELNTSACVAQHTCEEVQQKHVEGAEAQLQEVSERDLIIEEKQAQSEALRSSLADCDASIAGLEDQLAKSKANIRNLEAKFDAAVHEVKELREELAKVQHEGAQQEANYDRTVQSFMRRSKKLNLEVYTLKCEAQRRERYIRDLESRLLESNDVIDGADWELRQLQAENTGNDPNTAAV